MPGAERWTKGDETQEGSSWQDLLIIESTGFQERNGAFLTIGIAVNGLCAYTFYRNLGCIFLFLPRSFIIPFIRKRPEKSGSVS